MPASLTVVVIARDEARHIAACLASVQPLSHDLLVILDERTTDDTAHLAEAAGARVVSSRFVNFSAQRNRALQEAGGDYVLFIDADERCPAMLVAEISALLAQEPLAGYWLPRRNYFFGHLVNYAGWWPDYQLRLLRRVGTGYDEGREVHEEAILAGASGRLQQPLTHYNYDTWAQFRRKQRYYAGFEASVLHRSGQRAKLRNFVLQPLREFRRRYFTLGGWRGGPLGLALSAAMGWYELRKYWLLWRLRRQRLGSCAIIEVMDELRFVDLFCGIGGFRLAAESVCHARGLQAQCVFSSDIDPDAQRVYAANFGEQPFGDIREVVAEGVPDHDVLFAGFPCQPFSIIGDKRGFEDARGTLFFDVARILAAKRPQAFVLENVKMLVGHDQGRTLALMMETLRDIGYHASYRVLNALDYGLPQKRERVFIVGFLKPRAYCWPGGKRPMRSLATILETVVAPRYYASDYIQANRRTSYGRVDDQPTIWHENKAGHVSAYPFSCALRAGASYNYLLVNGERRLTEREMLRLQGFPDDFQIAVGYNALRRLAGNAVAVPCVEAVLHPLLDSLLEQHKAVEQQAMQINFLCRVAP